MEKDSDLSEALHRTFIFAGHAQAGGEDTALMLSHAGNCMSEPLLGHMLCSCSAGYGSASQARAILLSARRF